MDTLVVVLLVAALLAGVVAVVVGLDRYRPRDRSGFSMPTTEVHVDPVSGVRQRVYVDPVTGARSYEDEPAPIPGSAVPPLHRPGLVYPPAVGTGVPALPPAAPPEPPA